MFIYNICAVLEIAAPYILDAVTSVVPSPYMLRRLSKCFGNGWRTMAHCEDGDSSQNCYNRKGVNVIRIPHAGTSQYAQNVEKGPRLVFTFKQIWHQVGAKSVAFIKQLQESVFYKPCITWFFDIWSLTLSLLMSDLQVLARGIGEPLTWK